MQFSLSPTQIVFDPCKSAIAIIEELVTDNPTMLNFETTRLANGHYNATLTAGKVVRYKINDASTEEEARLKAFNLLYRWLHNMSWLFSTFRLSMCSWNSP